MLAQDAHPRRPSRTAQPGLGQSPYNVSVPVVLHLLARFPTLERVLVMVQLEAAERLARPLPGSRTFTAPPAPEAAWYGEVSSPRHSPCSIFWPVPTSIPDSSRSPAVTSADHGHPCRGVRRDRRRRLAQRRKMLGRRSPGSRGPPHAAAAPESAAGLDPGPFVGNSWTSPPSPGWPPPCIPSFMIGLGRDTAAWTLIRGPGPGPGWRSIQLRVGPLRRDGFHQLATVYQAVGLYDTVGVTAADDWGIVLSGRTVAGFRRTRPIRRPCRLRARPCRRSHRACAPAHHQRRFRRRRDGRWFG